MKKLFTSILLLGTLLLGACGNDPQSIQPEVDLTEEQVDAMQQLEDYIADGGTWSTFSYINEDEDIIPLLSIFDDFQIIVSDLEGKVMIDAYVSNFDFVAGRMSDEEMDLINDSFNVSETVSAKNSTQNDQDITVLVVEMMNDTEILFMGLNNEGFQALEFGMTFEHVAWILGDDIEPSLIATSMNGDILVELYHWERFGVEIEVEFNDGLVAAMTYK